MIIPAKEEAFGISVVVTCYNLQDYIAHAIRSALDQSVGFEVEVIVVDDCSTDSSLVEIEQFPRAKLLRTPCNSGVLLATILGMRAARFDIVAFLDGDDTWHPRKLEAVLGEFAADAGIGCVTHDLRYVDAQGRPLDRRSRPSMAIPGHASPLERERMVRTGILGQYDYVWLGSALSIKRSAIDAEAFCRFAESLPDPRNTYQDWPLAAWCAANPRVGLAYIPEKLFDYRLHGSNHSGDARSAGKAIRNVDRACKTLAACEAIIARFSAGDGYLQRTRRKRRYYESVLALYRREPRRAWCGFLSSLRYMSGGDVGFAKELARFVGVSILGYDRFHRLARRG